ncbi:MAG: hypothetical protein K2X90_00400 [Candidatus Babeliaceae bacterium]|nr:hypothetical protein [Candidatus Babeliaceae bacterium]
MKKQLLILSIATLLSATDAQAWYARGQNNTDSNVVVTLMTTSGGYTTGEVKPGEFFQIGDYNRCFGNVKVEVIDKNTNLRGQFAQMGRPGNSPDCSDWNNINIYQNYNQLRIESR